VIIFITLAVDNRFVYGIDPQTPNVLDIKPLTEVAYSIEHRLTYAYGALYISLHHEPEGDILFIREKYDYLLTHFQTFSLVMPSHNNDQPRISQ
jgi:hypothetical protein